LGDLEIVMFKEENAIVIISLIILRVLIIFQAETHAASIRYKLIGAGILQPPEGYATKSEACLTGGPYHDEAYGSPGCHLWSYPGGSYCDFAPNSCGGYGRLKIIAFCEDGTIFCFEDNVEKEKNLGHPPSDECLD
jgi:hypothetical protein